MNVGRPRTGEPKSRITLVPFAGISLIRFRGSRINGLSRCSIKHSALRQEETRIATGRYVNYSLTAQNSSRTCKAAGIVSTVIYIVVVS